MKHLSIFVLFFVIISLVLVPLCSAGASKANQDNTEGFQPVTSEYILHFKPGVSPGRMQQIYEALGNPPETEIPQINAGIVRLPLTDENVAALYSQYPEIELIEPDHMVQAMEVPDDIKFDQQWGLSKIEASKAWDLTQGSPSVKIAILDSGIDSDHTDLAGKVVVEKNFSDSPTTDDKYGHGTHAAGLAAALTGNAIGVAGLGYKTSLMNVKVLGDSGTGSYSWIIQGIIWAADNGADVINLSICGNDDSPAMKQAIEYAWDKGVVIVVAAGNNANSKPTFPASYSESIAVAATTSEDKLFSFSDYGDWVDLAAPGASISTLPKNSYGVMAGTSMASPLVAGLAGLAFSVARDTNGDGKTNDEVRLAIENGCDDIGITGIGKGRINAYKTISLLMENSGEPSLTGTFGLEQGDSIWEDTGNVLNLMQFSNSAGTGILEKLELRMTTSCPSGKVRLGIYADFNDKPGNRLLDAGETTVDDGWMVVSGLHLPVIAGKSYWLAFEQSSGNEVVFLSEAANQSRISHYWTEVQYGPLPGRLELNEAQCNYSPYVMRATVRRP